MMTSCSHSKWMTVTKGSNRYIYVNLLNGDHSLGHEKLKNFSSVGGSSHRSEVTNVSIPAAEIS